MALISSIFGAIANVFGLLTGRSALRNAPAMQANATAHTDARLKDTAAQTVADATTGDAAALEKLRKLAAE